MASWIPESASLGGKKMAKNQSKMQKNLRQFFRVFFSRGWVTKLCFGLIIIFVFCALFAPVLTQYTPYKQDLL